MYRRRVKQSKRMEAARAAKERKRLAGESPEYCNWQPPELRREVYIIDHDFGTVTHHIEMYKTGRRDTYRVEVDGKPWKNAGWSKVIEGVRKSFIRVRSG